MYVRLALVGERREETQSARLCACVVVNRGSTSMASCADDIRVEVVGDQRGVMLSGMGTGGTAGIGGAR